MERSYAVVGAGWYWYESVGSTPVQGLGHPTCVSCHRADYSSFVSGEPVTFRTKDFVLSPFPLK